jgi:hypothetical protein
MAHKASWREWGLALAVFLVLTALLMRNWLLGGLPLSHRQEVLTELSITWMFRQELAQGQLMSGWNPTWFSGFPWRRFLSYPLYYVLAGFSYWAQVPLEKVLVGFYFLVMAGSGLVMFGYLRRLLGDWRAALVAAVFYELVPFHAHVGVETWIHAAFWVLLPLPLWCIERSRASQGRRLGPLLAIGLTLGLFPVLSSEYALLAAPFIALYLGVREWERLRQGERWSRVVLEYLLVGGVALGVSAFFTVPALFETAMVGIHAKHGGEATLTSQLLADYSVTPRLVLYAIARRLHLAASRDGLPGLVNSFWSAAWYPGLLALPLVGLGILAVRRHFAAAAALVGLALSLLLVTGPTCALNFFSYLPVFGRLSSFRGLLMAAAFSAILIGYGVLWLLQRRFRGWAGSVLALALVLGLAADYTPSSDAFRTTASYFTDDERAAYAWLAAQEHPGRLLDIVTTPQNQYKRTYSLTLAPMPRFAGYYDNGAPLHTWQQLAWTDLATKLRLHQVRYAMVRNDDQGVVDSKRRLQAAGYEVAYQSGPVQVFENPANGNYVQVYARAVADLSDDFYVSFEVLPELVRRNMALVAGEDLGSAPDPRFYDYALVGPGATALAEDSSMRTLTASDLERLPVTAALNASVWTERLRYDRIYLEIEAPRALVLSISESWYPHWRVQVDGHPAQVLRVNWALLGVALEPGNHRVTFEFTTPWYDRVASGISLLTLLGLVLWWTQDVARRLRIPAADNLAQLQDGYRQPEDESHD